MDADIATLTAKAKDYALTHGLVICSKHCSTEAVHAPFTLYPSSYPTDCFRLAERLQPLFNTLIDLISLDHTFIASVMSEIVKSDTFMQQTYDIYTQARLKPHFQRYRFGIHRSDYLLHMSGDAVKIQQVELNTIASSFAALATKTSQLHQYMQLNAPESVKGTVPMNKSLESVSMALFRGKIEHWLWLCKAFELYGKKEAVILFVVQIDERNIFDQRWLEQTLLERYGYTLVTCVDASDDVEVAVVYFRAGYTPRDYPSDSEWNARVILEESLAYLHYPSALIVSIKCPDIAYHLVGSKKIQQVIALPMQLERWIKSEEDVALIRSCFTGLYPLDESIEGLQAYANAIQHPERYVMKPQREGGGNNIYGLDIPAFIKSLSVEERKAYILMDLIDTTPHENYMVRDSKAVKVNVITELGIYGAWLSDGDTVLLNTEAGYLMRTKAVGTNEGGVATGYSVLDSPLLI